MKPKESRPLPIRTTGTSAFFDGAKNGTLMLQHCQSCRRINLSGHLYCPVCLAATEWRPSEGLGQIASFSIVRESSHAGFKRFLPYAVAEVTLSEGPTLKLRVVGGDPEKLYIGQQVKVDFLDDELGESTPVCKLMHESQMSEN
jgi:uncharacterized protein